MTDKNKQVLKTGLFIILLIDLLFVFIGVIAIKSHKNSQIKLMEKESAKVVGFIGNSCEELIRDHKYVACKNLLEKTTKLFKNISYLKLSFNNDFVLYEYKRSKSAEKPFNFNIQKQYSIKGKIKIEVEVDYIEIVKDIRIHYVQLGVFVFVFSILLFLFYLLLRKISIKNIQLINEVAVRKKSEEMLAIEKEKLSIVFRSMGDGMIATDEKGNVIIINKAGSLITEWEIEDAIGKKINDVFKVESKNEKNIFNKFQQVLQQGISLNLPDELTLTTKNGKLVDIGDSVSPLKNLKSEVVGLVIVFRDLTNQKKFEKEYQKMKKMETIGILAGGIAHDFNNFLASLLTNTTLAQLKLQKGENPTEILKRIENECERSKHLSRQLLTFAKGGDPVIEASDITDVLTQTVSFVLSGTNISFEFNFDKNLFSVNCDEGQISEVVQNIVINAKHAMPSGGNLKVICKNVEVEKETLLPLKKGKYIEVTIKDNGNGIPDEVKEHIFDPFFTTKKSGTGLGLAVSYSIVKKHGGFLTFDSKINEGTSFIFYLPAVETGEKKNKSNKLMSEINLKGISVLILDDEDVILEATKDILEMFECEVLTSKTGEETIEVYKSRFEAGKPVDVVILDLTVPGGLGGEQVIKHLKLIDENVKAIVSSGYSASKIMCKYREYGFVASLTKPYTFSKLKETIQSII